VRETPVLPPVRYAELLRRLGFRDQHVRLQVYVHELPEPAEVVEWVRGTLLTDYERRMAPQAFARYVDEYRERLLGRIGSGRPYLYTYQRILFWAER
jgi:trans-aconitate 2-methyltransferase